MRACVRACVCGCVCVCVCVCVFVCVGVWVSGLLQARCRLGSTCACAPLQEGGSVVVARARAVDRASSHVHAAAGLDTRADDDLLARVDESGRSAAVAAAAARMQQYDAGVVGDSRRAHAIGGFA